MKIQKQIDAIQTLLNNERLKFLISEDNKRLNFSIGGDNYVWLFKSSLTEFYNAVENSYSNFPFFFGGKQTNVTSKELASLIIVLEAIIKNKSTNETDLLILQFYDDCCHRGQSAVQHAAKFLVLDLAALVFFGISTIFLGSSVPIIAAAVPSILIIFTAATLVSLIYGAIVGDNRTEANYLLNNARIVENRNVRYERCTQGIITDSDPTKFFAPQKDARRYQAALMAKARTSSVGTAPSV